MINKYTGLTLLLLALVSIIACWMIYKKYTERFYVSSNNSNTSNQLIKDIQIKPEAFESLTIMQEVVDKLSKETDMSETNVSLAYSPVENKDKRPLVTIPTDKEKQRLRALAICRQARKMNVSMSFVSENEEYAVVADKFVREGQVMANKFKVLNIESDKIEVQKQGVRCSIKVSNSNITQL